MDLHAVNEHIAIQLKARNEVLLRKFTQLYNLKFELGLMGNDPFNKPLTDLRDQIKELKNKLALSRRNDKYDYLWVTVSISPKWCLDYMSPDGIVDELDQACHDHLDMLYEMNDALLKKAHKYASSAMFEDYIFVFEQRESEFCPAKIFVGQHFHFLLKRNRSYCHSQIVRNTKNVWRKYCNVDNSEILNIHKCPEKFVKDKIQYCLGEKTGDGKDKKVAVDQQFRDRFEIKKLYRNSEDMTNFFLDK